MMGEHGIDRSGPSRTDLVLRRRAAASRSAGHSASWLASAIMLSLGAMVFESLGPAASAQTDSLTVQLQPAAIEFSNTDQSLPVILVLANPNDMQLTDVAVSSISPDGIRVQETTEPQSVSGATPAAGDVAWEFTVDQEGEDVRTGTVLFRVTLVAGTGDAATARVLVASLAVTQAKTAATSDVVDVSVKTSLSTLDESVEGTIYLVMTNKAEFPVLAQVTRVRPRSLSTGDPLEIGFVYTKQQRSVASGATTVFPIVVRKTGRIPQGPYLLLFDIRLQWTEDGQEVVRTLVADHQVTVGVFGESALSKELTIPSILVLPGFIVLAITGFLWSLHLRRSPDDKSPFPDFKAPMWWVLAISISGLFIAAYKWLPWVRVDFLRGYDLFDLIGLWLVSVAVAVIGYIAFASWWRWWTRRRTFMAGDDGVVVLRRLYRRGKGLFLPRLTLAATTGVNPELRRAFLLEELDDRTHVWVTPPLVVTWITGATPELRAEMRNLLSSGAMGRASSGALADLLEGGIRTGQLKVGWGSRFELSRPRRVKVPENAEELEPNLWVWDE
jgi:hypothetical protein